MKKYEIVRNDCIVYNGKTLYRIRALKYFGYNIGKKVRKGELGGYIESENNLSQKRSCWIYDDAKVCGNAKVSGNACVYENAIVSDDADIRQYVRVHGNARICNKAYIFGNAEIYDNAVVSGNAWISDKAKVKGNAQIFDSEIFGNAKVHGKSYIFGDAVVCDNAEICGCAKIFGVAKIGGDKIIKEGNYFFKSFTDIEALNEIKTVCYKISFAVRVIELKLPIEQGYIESLNSQFAEYNKLADSFCGRTYLSPKEEEILAMLSQCKEDVKILKKVVLKMKVKKGEKIKYEF